MKNNIHQCHICKQDIIEEESDSHICFSGRIINYYFDTSEPNSIMVYDGKKSFSVPISLLKTIMKIVSSTDRKHDKDYRQGNRA